MASVQIHQTLAAGAFVFAQIKVAHNANIGGTVLAEKTLSSYTANRRDGVTVYAEFVWPGPGFDPLEPTPYFVNLVIVNSTGNTSGSINSTGPGWMSIDEVL